MKLNILFFTINIKKQSEEELSSSAHHLRTVNEQLFDEKCKFYNL